jgi:hypothetical protein
MLTNNSAEAKPCRPMRSLLSQLSDGTLHGIARWFAERHTAGCPHCSATLTSLVVLEGRLRALGVPEILHEEGERLPPALRQKLSEELDRVDAA